MPTKTSRELLPPLRARVLISGEKEVSDALREVVSKAPEAVARGKPYQAILRDTRVETIRTAVGAPEVVRIDIDRPKARAPVQRLPHAPSGFVPLNRDARLSHSLPLFEGTFHNGQGSTLTAAVFDEGLIRRTHVEFRVDRVKIGAPAGAEDAHATHVGGTMAAAGAKPEARGMAPKLTLLSYTWEDDLRNLEAAADEIPVSNHSYGVSAGWDFDRIHGCWVWWGDLTVSGVEDAVFGKYAIDASLLDGVLHRHPHLLSVVAAGNDRDDCPTSQPIPHYVWSANPATGDLEWGVSYDEHRLDGFDRGGLDTLSGYALAKNALCVGAIDDLFDAESPIPGRTIQSTRFSSWGPTDDGRIKPDVVANGDSLLSPTVPPYANVASPDEVYQEMSGTSMACPTVSGICCVLAEFFNVKLGRAPSAAELKAIVIHGAVDAGIPGPDPALGWGSIDAYRSGEIIAGQNAATVRLETVSEDQGFVRTFTTCSQAVRATIVWTDPPAEANAGGLDDAAPTLVNDLDLTLTDPSGRIHHPYRIDTEDPLGPALTDGPNR
ncbi:MAG: S8 family serine peptidase, partial [Planctomycetes bacterium]|nr:S8 family serine peptidase [Planctomycetota bacterium]